MMQTNLLYAVFRSVQSIWSSWHGQVIFSLRIEDLHEICFHILAKLQTGHLVVNSLQRATFKLWTSSLWRLIGPGCSIRACQRSPFSFEAGRGIQEFGFHCRTQRAVNAAGGSFSSIICCLCFFFSTQTTEESLSRKRVLFMVFQWMPLSLRSSNDTRLVTKSVQNATFLSLRTPFASFSLIVWTLTSP